MGDIGSRNDCEVEIMYTGHPVDELVQNVLKEHPHAALSVAYRETARRLYDTINPVGSTKSSSLSERVNNWPQWKKEYSFRPQEAEPQTGCDNSSGLTQINAPSCTQSAAGDVVEEMQAKADKAYLDYINYVKRPECLGEEIKIQQGKFGREELNAHREAAQLIGKHRAYADAAKSMSAAREVAIRGYVPEHQALAEKHDLAIAFQKKVAELEQQLASMGNTLCNIAQILDVVKSEWGDSWSAWDQEQRDAISKFLAQPQAKEKTKQEKVEAILRNQYGHSVKEGHNLAAAKIIAALAPRISDCCRADAVYTSSSPSFWQCSKCKLTCAVEGK